MNESEWIEVSDGSLAPGQKWLPKTKDETIKLQKTLAAIEDFTPDAWNKLLEESLRILSRCANPMAAPEAQTGIVIGNVQSGKTMSFTTVATLAKDNGFRLIILVAGTKINLFDQSALRLRKHLQIDSRDDYAWRILPKFDASPEMAKNLARVLTSWDHPLASDRQTLLLLVRKNPAGLSKLVSLLNQPILRKALEKSPTLIIDDEADQAGLNTQARQGDQSSTYLQLLALKTALPHHTLLQYTATPQAPLLIALNDLLSPKFATVLTPGDGYIGGKKFFVESPDDLVKIIPDKEISVLGNKLAVPPASLMEALQIFILGVSDACEKKTNKKHRSMLVHPSRETFGHGQYKTWVHAIIDRWQKMIAKGSGQALSDLFDEPWRSLQKTVPDLTSKEILLKRIGFDMDQISIKTVNSPSGSEINWSAGYAHILIGGQAIDRGFTVKGLTVTYMPRGAGGRQADTIQQRARFFGYHAPYLGYCRAYISEEMRKIYHSYVSHEEDMQERLRKNDSEGKSLDDWKRAFLLHKDLNPTRKQVLSLNYTQANYSDTWVHGNFPHLPKQNIELNRQLLRGFVEGHTFVEDEGDERRTVDQRHLTAKDILLTDVYENLLSRFRTGHPKDSIKLTGILLQLSKHLVEHKDETCDVFLMRKLTSRVRGLDKNEKLIGYFQGRNKDIYPGDAAVRAKNKLTIQLSLLNVGPGEKPKVFTDKDVPFIAVWIPESMGMGWLAGPTGFVA